MLHPFGLWDFLLFNLVVNVYEVSSKYFHLFRHSLVYDANSSSGAADINIYC
jgi:hypothetical protein